MNITSFDDLLSAAHSQPDAQTLLMVFVDVELPPDASAAERERHGQGLGGTLTPRMCVDRAASELTGWPSLVAEADQQSSDWRFVVVAALSTPADPASRSAGIDQALNRMVMAVHQGQIERFITFDRTGAAVRMSAMPSQG